MKATVNPNTCIGCGLCPSICPEVFEMKENLAEVIVDQVPKEVEDKAREAAESCPVNAITIEE